MCLLLLLIWSEDGEYSGQSLMFSVQTHTLLNHSEDNWQCFLAVVLAVCFALSIMILNVRKQNVVFFQGLFNPEVRYSLRVILSVILGFFTGYSGSGWEKNKKNARNFQKWRIWRIAAPTLCVCVLGGLVTPGSPAAWLLKCWSGWTNPMAAICHNLRLLPKLQLLCWASSPGQHWHLGCLKKKMAAWWLMGWDL